MVACLVQNPSSTLFVNNFVSFYTRHDPQIQAATFDQLNAELKQIRRSI